MSKTNPLFVDSTKFRGELIATQIELRGVMVYEGEDLCVTVVSGVGGGASAGGSSGVTAAASQSGSGKRAVMKVLPDGNFETRVHLNHQTPIRIQFSIEKAGQIVLRSVIYEGWAQYAILEEWRPALTEAERAEVLEVPNLMEPPKSQLTWAKESSMTVKSLIDKWGL